MTSDETSWHKSSYSGSSGSCVEVAEAESVRVRDTQNRDLGHLGFSAPEWAAFLVCVRDREL
ncbi:DUF397 domain-containing protein [Nocardiopsis suaedae]|uniref:DUF397 domain-containing protein n=1 Tax=Nocardiopsis suaedae TaxID=3018444 RepID=A0ABT4THW6_9ACTN|nr:DUF397 domain-containing protein [Nocardiopsis suaedae]MDA2803682.1 DUF397 domain-containing protein [Nocardiopsis suaedae]